MVMALVHTTMQSLLMLMLLVILKLTTMVLMVKTPMPSVVLTMPTRAAITTSRSGEPLRGRAFRSNLRFAPISSAIPLASAPFGRCALRLPKKRTRRADDPGHRPDSGRCTSCLAGAGWLRRLVHYAVQWCPHQCGHLRPSLRQRASRDCLRRWPHCPPLKRRGGSPPPASPASIPPSLMPHDCRSLDRRGGLGFSHPTQRAAGRAIGIYGMPFRGLSVPLGVWVLLDRAYVGATYAPCHILGSVRLRLSPTDIRPPRDRHTTDIRPSLFRSAPLSPLVLDRHTARCIDVGSAAPSNALRTPLAIAILVWFWYQENFRNEGSRPSIRDIRDTVQAPGKGA